MRLLFSPSPIKKCEKGNLTNIKFYEFYSVNMNITKKVSIFRNIAHFIAFPVVFTILESFSVSQDINIKKIDIAMLIYFYIKLFCFFFHRKYISKSYFLLFSLFFIKKYYRYLLRLFFTKKLSIFSITVIKTKCWSYIIFHCLKNGESMRVSIWLKVKLKFIRVCLYTL